uniref:keratinocyte-associated protein 3-like n=1 Tax=Myxine glutinosa TaxID=7769 RepID=UPI00358F896C
MVCGFDAVRGRRRLMRVGILLIVLGNISFICGAIVHGTVLRHVAHPKTTINVTYKLGNFSSVLSGLMCIAAGIVAVLLSRNVQHGRLQMAMLITAVLGCLLTFVCLVVLLVDMSLTVHDEGHALSRACSERQGPFVRHSDILFIPCTTDPGRIYDTTMALWITNIILAAVELGFCFRCLFVSLNLRGCSSCQPTYHSQDTKAAEPVSSMISLGEDAGNVDYCDGGRKPRVKFALSPETAGTVTEDRQPLQAI